MANAHPEKWLGRTAVIVFQRPGEGPVWHQGQLQEGHVVGLPSKFAFSNMWANGRDLWQEIPDDAAIVTLLPHPATNAVVRVVNGEHAGRSGVVTGTAPPRAAVTVRIETIGDVELPAIDVELV
jgi:hypothetical protein